MRETHTQNMQYLFTFHGNIYFANEPCCCLSTYFASSCFLSCIRRISPFIPNGAFSRILHEFNIWFVAYAYMTKRSVFIPVILRHLRGLTFVMICLRLTDRRYSTMQKETLWFRNLIILFVVTMKIVQKYISDVIFCSQELRVIIA